MPYTKVTSIWIANIDVKSKGKSFKRKYIKGICGYGKIQ
jgi:hypothetical protein